MNKEGILGVNRVIKKELVTKNKATITKIGPMKANQFQPCIKNIKNDGIKNPRNCVRVKMTYPRDRKTNDFNNFAVFLSPILRLLILPLNKFDKYFIMITLYRLYYQ